MKKDNEEVLKERIKVLEKELRDLCNLIMKIKRTADKKGMWISAGVNPYAELTEEAQQGPMITELYTRVDNIRNYIRKDK